MHKKYTNTLLEIEKDLHNTQKEFIEMTNKLTGSEKDLLGLKELQKLLEGNYE